MSRGMKILGLLNIKSPETSHCHANFENINQFSLPQVHETVRSVNSSPKTNSIEKSTDDIMTMELAAFNEAINNDIIIAVEDFSQSENIQNLHPEKELGSNLCFLNDADVVIENNVELTANATIENNVENIREQQNQLEISIEQDHESKHLDNGKEKSTTIEKDQAEEWQYSKEKQIIIINESEINSDESRHAPVVDSDSSRDKQNKINSQSNDMNFLDEIDEPNNYQANNETEDTQRNSKKRKFSNVKRDYNYQQNKIKRETGLDYNGKKKIDGKWDYHVSKPGKVLSIPCRCTLSTKRTTKILECHKLKDIDRLAIFNSFWKKTWQEKREYVRGLCNFQNVERRRNNGEGTSRRNFSIKYYLKCNLQQYRVCKKMFINTLGLKENCILNWIKNGDELNVEPNNDIRRSSSSRKRISKNLTQNVSHFFNSLAKMESHYCRASTQRLYLEPLWQSKQELYRFYVESYCVEQKLKPVSRTKFNEIFQEMNLSLFHPKKDQCDTCVAYNTKNTTQEEYDNHLIQKREARDAKNNDKNSVAPDFVYTMDLQSVLLAPRNKVGAMYYKTKLAVHNFTIYNIKTHEGYCYLWNETEGALTANDFSSILVDLIENEIMPNVKDESSRIIFWSDGCTGQNRNAQLSNALLQMSVSNNITIIQKYLLKGHTQMEADSMHSAIERSLRNRNINLPADYVTYCQNARKKPFEYKVKYLEYSFFKDFSSIKYYPSIRPGRKVGDPTVTDLKAIKYTPNGEIQYKLRHSEDDWNAYANMRVTKLQQGCDAKDLPNLYNGRRKIKKEKFEHLQILKKSLDQDYHTFYDNIPFQ